MTTEHVFYSLIGSFLAGEKRNAYEAMESLAKERQFTIVDSCPQSIADGWQFTICYDHRPDLPEWVSRDSRSH